MEARTLQGATWLPARDFAPRLFSFSPTILLYSFFFLTLSPPWAMSNAMELICH